MNLIARLRRRWTPWTPGCVWDGDAHSGWGDSILLREGVSLVRGATCEFTGWTRPRVRVDDEIRKTTASGHVARLRVVKADYPRDPPDMWHAEAEFVGWLEEAMDAPPVTRFGVFGNKLP